MQFIVGPLGASRQRNAGIEVVPATGGYVAFMDDDFEMKPDYLEQAVAFLNANSGVVALSGLDLAGRRSMPREQARRILKAFLQ